MAIYIVLVLAFQTVSPNAKYMGFGIERSKADLELGSL